MLPIGEQSDDDDDPIILIPSDDQPPISDDDWVIVRDPLSETEIFIGALEDILRKTGDNESADLLRNTWKAQREIMKSEAAITKTEAEIKEQRQRDRRIQEALAKGLPALATGLRDAIKGFQSGDSFAGSAAVMEICATLSLTVGAMTAAGGPPGALVGALFSIVAMILKMFVKPQKTLTAQIEEVIRTIKSESKIQDLQMAQQAIESFRNTLISVGQKWTLAEIEAKLNLIEGPAINAIRGAAAWLQEANNQDVPLWGHVLAAQCQAYISLMEALTLGIASIDIANLEDKGVLSIAKLTAAFNSNNPAQFSFLQDIQPAARNRGFKWHIGRFNTGQYLESGELFRYDVSKGGWKSLGGDMRVVTISKTQTKQRLDPNPYFAIFHLEQADIPSQRPEFSNRYRKNNRTYGMFGKWPLDRNTGWQEIRELQGLYDICATPGAGENEVYVYTADGKGIDMWVTSGAAWDKGYTTLQRSRSVKFEQSDGDIVRAVCAVSKPRTGPGEDVSDLAEEEWVVYGGCETANKEIFINAYFSSGANCRFPCGSVYGITTDSRYLWTFGKESIACIPHLLVKRFSQRKSLLGNWSYYTYTIPPELRITTSDPRDHSFDGLLDLASCDDGTLMAVFNKGGKHMYVATPMHVATHSAIVIKGEKKDVTGNPISTHGWERLTEGEANRIYKQPIFCWSMIEGLLATLAKV